MDKSGLLKSIADTGYNVGFGAKKHFATFDIVQKGAGWVAFISFFVGVFALVYEPLSNKFIGASVVVLGIIGLYVALYESEKKIYEENGVKLTKLFNRLRDLYRAVKSVDDAQDVGPYQQQLAIIENEYYDACSSKQILFSDWYAHYKFFWQHQIDWVDEQKHFGLFRDKLPLSFMLFVVVAVIGVTGAVLEYHPVSVNCGQAKAGAPGAVPPGATSKPR